MTGRRFFASAMIVFILAIAVILAGTTSGAQMNSTNYGISTAIVDSGGTNTSSNNYKGGSVIGSIAGAVASALYKAFFGFYHTIFEFDDNPPQIMFVPPTLDNGSFWLEDVNANVSISEENLREVKFNWNGTNYTIYNDSLVLMLNMDNRSSLGENNSFVRDLSIYENNGIAGNMTWNITGRYGGGFQFNVSNQSIDVPSSASLNLRDFTISAWFLLNDPGYYWYRTIVIKYNFTDHRANFWLQTLGPELACGFTNVTDTTRYFENVTSGLNIIPGRWYHAACTYNGKNIRMYLDGRIVFNGSFSSNPVPDLTNADLMIGREPPGNYWNGTIDETMVWNRALIPDEIKQIYSSNLQKYNMTQWYLYMNESNLSEGDYSYFACAKDKTLENCTEKRYALKSLAPQIKFEPPTPPTGVIRPGYIGINVSIGEDNLKNAKFNWNGINYSLYDNYLILMMNMDNKSILGENSSYVKDLSGKGNNGKVVNSALWSESGKYSGAYDFSEGISEVTPARIEIPDSLNLDTILDNTGKFTLAAWIYPNQVNAQSNIMGYSLLRFTLSSSRLYIYFYDYSGYDLGPLFSLPVLTSGQWQHVAVTYDYITNNVSFYRNGVHVGSEILSGVPDLDGDSSFFIGNVPDWYEVFNGSIDEVRVWSRNLSSSEIVEAYRSNLEKHNQTLWYLYSYRDDLPGKYNYYACARDKYYENCTEERIINIGMNLSECSVLDVPGYYNLTKSVKSTGTCFNITTNDVTLDCKGYLINYSINENGYGIVSTGDYTNIRNCRIEDNAYAGAGIYFDRVKFGGVENNTIRSHADNTAGIEFVNANNSFVVNNTMNLSCNHDCIGINIGLSFYNTLNSNLVYTSNNADGGYSLWLLDAGFNNFSFDTFESYGSYITLLDLGNNSNNNYFKGDRIVLGSGTGSQGILVNGASYNIFSNVSVLQKGGSVDKGIVFGAIDSDRNIFINLVVNLSSLNANAFYISEGNNNFTLKDSRINSTAAGTADFYIFQNVIGGEWNFTNVSFTDKYRASVANGTLNVHWYLGLNVTNALAEPVAGAIVNISDIYDTSHLSIADINGTLLDTLIQYSENRTKTKFFTNYTINVSKAQYNGKKVSINITRSTYMNIILNQYPEVTLWRPRDGEDVHTFGYAGLNYSVRDADNELMEVWVYGWPYENNLPMEENLLYHARNVGNGNFIYNWQGKMIERTSPGLVALYHFDNRSEYGENSSLIYDFSGNGNNGTVMNGAAWVEKGKFAGAYRFNVTTNNVVLVKDSDILDITQNVTLMAWVKRSGTFSYGGSFRDSRIIAKLGDGSDTMYGILTEGSELPYRAKCEFFIGTQQQLYAPANYLQEDNVWLHLACVYNGTTMSLYVNGRLVSSLNVAGSISVSNGNLTIGNGRETVVPPFDRQFNGTIDEIGIWNRSLSGDEIKDYYDLTVGRYYWTVNATNANGSTLASQTYFIVPDLPFTSRVLFNSSFGTNFTWENLTCFAEGVDELGPESYLSAYWRIYNWSKIFSEGKTDLREELNNISDMVYLFHFNNDTRYRENSTRAYDFTGSGHNATCPPGAANNPCPRFVKGSGNTGGAFNFSYNPSIDNNTHFVVKDSNGLSLVNSTFSAWIYWVNDTGYSIDDNVIVSHGGKGISEYYIFRINNNGQLQFRYNLSSGGGVNDITSTSIIRPYLWYNVAFVKNNDMVIMYINGFSESIVESSAGRLSGGYTGAINPQHDVWIGEEGGIEISEGFNGYIDEIAFWNRSLTGDEILGNYNRGKGIFVFKNLTTIDAKETSAGDNWTCSVFMGNIRKNETNLTEKNNATIWIKSDFPFIYFTPNTPDNGSLINGTIEINVSLGDIFGLNGPGLREVLFNWNGTNYTYYNGSVLYYNFDNRSSLGENNSYIVDVSRGGNNGNIFGTKSWVAGMYGRALQFDGGTTYINISNSNSLDVAGNITIAFWINPSYKGSDVVVLEKRWYANDYYSPFYQYGIEMSGGGYLNFYFGDRVGGLYSISTSNPITYGSWQHIVFTCNGSYTTSYVNGVLDNTKGSALGCIVARGNHMTIGADPTLNQKFQGILDEVKIYNKSLSAGEVRGLYYGSLTKYNGTYWSLFLNISGITEGTYKFYSSVVDSDGNINRTETRSVKRGNNKPVVTLIYPGNNYYTTNRTQNFSWSGSDADGDPLAYELNITCWHESGQGCSADNRNYTVSGSVFIIPNYLRYFYDDGFYYNWTVRAFDGFEWGNWAVPIRRLNIQGMVATSLNPEVIDFGSMVGGETKDTTTGAPLPFVLQNDGNCMINVSVNATALFSSVPLDMENYQYKIDVEETGSFDTGKSLMNFVNFTSALVPSIFMLNWSDMSDTAQIDVRVKAPIGEVSGDKLSNVVFASKMSGSGTD